MTPLDKFQSMFRGKIIQPGDSSYEGTRKVYNAMIDRHPRLIVSIT